jgi:predicted acetyltransferase
MRTQGTKYEPIEILPANAVTVSQYAKEQGKAVGYIYIKYQRYLSKGGKHPGYSIRCFKGINFILPE